MEKQVITIETNVNAPIEKVWELWNGPEHIVKWNNASDEWHTPSAKNDLRKGGKLISRMEAKDGSAGFDFEGTYDEVVTHEFISYTLDDGRTVKITFTPHKQTTKIVEAFEAESLHPIEMQRGGWQAILDNFKRYAEAN